jgi:hypothetical protein
MGDSRKGPWAGSGKGPEKCTPGSTDFHHEIGPASMARRSRKTHWETGSFLGSCFWLILERRIQPVS